MSACSGCFPAPCLIRFGIPFLFHWFCRDYLERKARETQMATTKGQGHEEEKKVSG